jgi:hypothetical protein
MVLTPQETDVTAEETERGVDKEDTEIKENRERKRGG